jgi:hypothetical protein
MVERPIGDAQQDVGGTTQYTGTVGTTAVLVPASPGNPIILALIECPSQLPNSKYLLYSLDDITYHKVGNGNYIGWPFKGNITQLYVKGSVAGVEYQIMINTEPT